MIKAHIPVGSSRLDTTRHVRRVQRVETSASSRAVRKATQPKCMGSQNASCRVETWRDETSGILA